MGILATYIRRRRFVPSTLDTRIEYTLTVILIGERALAGCLRPEVFAVDLSPW